MCFEKDRKERKTTLYFTDLSYFSQDYLKEKSSLKNGEKWQRPPRTVFKKGT